MALPLVASRDIHIEVVGELISRPYIEITLKLLGRFGIEVRREAWQRFTIPAGSQYQSPGEIHVEGDASSASYFIALGAIAESARGQNGLNLFKTRSCPWCTVTAQLHCKAIVQHVAWGDSEHGEHTHDASSARSTCPLRRKKNSAAPKPVRWLLSMNQWLHEMRKHRTPPAQRRRVADYHRLASTVVCPGWSQATRHCARQRRRHVRPAAFRGWQQRRRGLARRAKAITPPA
jgi:hypothetical protein